MAARVIVINPNSSAAVTAGIDAALDDFPRGSKYRDRVPDA